MPKKLSKALTPIQVRNAQPGRHADGDGLYLLVKKTGARSWVFRFMLNGRSRDIGLSRCPEAIDLMAKSGGAELTLAQARDVAAIYRIKVKAGIDPLTEREVSEARAAAEAQAQRAAAVTFRDAAEMYLSANEKSWRNPKHRQQWRNTLEAYVFPVMGDIPVADISTPMVLRVIEPMWQAKPETASRVRGRIETILDAAAVRGFRAGDNPARWRGHLARLLPARTKLSRGHHEALDYRQMPEFISALRARQAVAALALEFTILTAARTGEVLGATWAEVDLDAALWTVPAARMKAGKEHRVPLSDRAVAILREVKQLGSNWLFPGQRGGRLSGMSMAMLLRRMKADVTVHGFRSAFRDWAAESTAYPHEVCEMALAHTIANKSEAAYRRGDLFDKRCRLMQDWGSFCEGGQTLPSVIVPMRKHAG
jgi:integrase